MNEAQTQTYNEQRETWCPSGVTTFGSQTALAERVTPAGAAKTEVRLE